MPAKKQTVVLQIDLDLPKGKIKEFNELLNNSTKIKMDSGLGKNLFSSLNSSIKEATTDATKLLKLFNKPVKNAESAKQLGDSFSKVFKDLNNKLLSFQGNLAKTFNSKENQEAIKTYKQLGDTIDNLNKNYKKVSELNNKRSALGNTGLINKEINAAKKEQKILEKDKSTWGKEEKARYEELNKIIEEGNQKLLEKEKINKRISTIHSKSGVSSQGQLESKIQELSKDQLALGNGILSQADLDILNNKINNYRNDLRLLNDETQDLGNKSEESWNRINLAQEQASRKIKTFKEVLQGLGIGLGITELARGFKELALYSFDFYKQLDKSLTNIAIVTRKTREEVQAFTKDFILMAKQTGMSIDDIAQGAVIFFQQGLSDEEALKMTQVAAEFAKVADITVESASDKLTAAVNGYGMAVEEAAIVADKLNVLAAESAASIDELATAMEKGASMAAQAGLSFDQYNAILSTMIEVTREAPENIGTSMKTIMARFQQVKESGTTEEGDTDVNQVETALKSVGVALRDGEGILRDLGDVLNDLGPKWNSLDRNTQAYLGTIIAGTRQQSRFISLMQNWDRALQLTEASEQSAGAQALQHQAAMEGLEASINNLTIAWQNLLTKLTSSDLFKGIVDALTGIVNLLGSTNVKGVLFTAALIGGVLKLNQYLNNTRQIIANGGEASVNWLYKLNEALAGNGSGGINNFLLAMRTAWKLNDVEATNFFTKAIIRAKSLSGVIGSSLLTGVKKLGVTLKTLFKNLKTGIADMAKNNPLAMVGLITSITSIIGGLIDNAVFDGDRKLEETNKALEETLNKMEIASGKISVIESNLDAYLELKDAIALSTEEQEKLNNATAALAENVEDAVIGYNAMGEAILDINKINEAKDKAEKDKEDAARSTFGNIGANIAADLESRGEEAYKEKWYGGINAQSAGTAGALAGAAIGSIIPGLGTAAGIVIGGAIGGAVGLFTGWVTSAVGALEEEKKLAAKEYGKLLREKQSELLTAMDTITDAYVSYGEDIVDEGGRVLASAEDKENVAARLQSEFLNSKTEEIGQKVIDGELTPDEAAEELEKLGSQWEDTIMSIGDGGINAITAQAMELQRAVDTENKSWNEIKDSIQNTLDNLDIPEESRDAIEEAFKASVYSGTSSGVYQAMKDLERQQEQDTSEEAYKEDTGGKAWYKPWTWFRQGYDSWKEDIDAEYEKYWDMVNNMGSNELSAYGNMGLTANKDLLELYNSNYSSGLRSALNLDNETATNLAGLSGLYDMQDEIESKLSEITDTTSDEYKKWEQMSIDTKNAIETTWNNLPMAVEPTWEQLFEQYEEFTERVSTVWETLGEIKEDGGIDYDQFKDLATLFDDIDTSMFNPDQLYAYGDALQTIADNLVLVDGELKLNEEALSSVGQLEETLAQAQIDGIKTKLIAKRTELEAQKEMIVADIAYMNAQLEVARSVVNGTYSQEDATASLDEAKRNFTSNAAALLATYSNNEYLAAQRYANNWTTAFDQVADEYNKLLYARMTGTKADNKIVTELQDEGLNLSPTTENLYDFKNMGKDEAQKAIDELTASIAAAEHALASYDLSINNINLKLALLNSGIKSSEDGYTSAGEALDEYISKLEKFLNLLRHIEREEFNLKVAEQLEEMQTGEKVIKRMGDQLRYINHLIGDTKEMYNNYEKEANTSAADILKGFGDIVKFNEWGNYEVDMALYNKLSDEKKELLDESLDAYQELIEERDSYYESYLDYIKKQQDVNQKYVDKYIEAEDELVEAIKQREQKILDNKLAAIDKEIEAIEKASDARRKAREEEQNAEELSNMQIDLQRALMDSSGASATQILELQKQIKDKQQEMADNSFDTMVEDMTQQLEDEKELEQQLFDERLEEMDWYWNEVDRIMAEGTESIIDTMKTYLDVFNQSSELQQVELLKGWENTFAQAIKIGKEGAKDYQEIVNSLQGTINNQTVDEDILTSNTINTKFEKRPETEEDKPKQTTSSNSSSGSYYKPSSTQQTSQKTETPKATYYTITLNEGTKTSTKTVKSGNSVTLPVLSRSGYTFNGWDIPSLKICTIGAYTYKPTQNETVTARWKAKSYYSAPTFSPNINTSYFPTFGSAPRFASGGMAYHTGPAWLDGTASQPEAVLNALQTKAFLSFTDNLAALRTEGNIPTNSSITIDSISFNVESMSSIADGEKAFNTFVDKFKEIGAKQGISIIGTANRN